MIFPEEKERFFADEDQLKIFNDVLHRLEEASGGFDHHSHGDIDGGKGMLTYTLLRHGDYN